MKINCAKMFDLKMSCCFILRVSLSMHHHWTRIIVNSTTLYEY